VTELYEYVHTPERDEKFAMPYTPGIKVTGGHIVYLAGVTAAPVYHSHPHIPEEFDDVPTDAGKQAALAVENVRRSVVAAGGTGLENVVEMTLYTVDTAANQGAIGAAIREAMGDHRPASTSVEIVRLATDPRLILEIKAVAVVPE
jgi:enamine deaminase RidA (YjgF/YER057c/UK114 family)